MMLRLIGALVVGTCIVVGLAWLAANLTLKSEKPTRKKRTTRNEPR